MPAGVADDQFKASVHVGASLPGVIEYRADLRVQPPDLSGEMGCAAMFGALDRRRAVPRRKLS